MLWRNSIVNSNNQAGTGPEPQNARNRWYGSAADHIMDAPPPPKKRAAHPKRKASALLTRRACICDGTPKCYLLMLDLYEVAPERCGWFRLPKESTSWKLPTGYY
jgi:hypothetical protein